MPARGFTHVSIHARDLEESARFYREIFGVRELSAPDFPFPVRWFRVGELQLHLFLSEDSAPRAHHFGIDVDDFEAVYRRAKELGIVDGAGHLARIYELPDGAVQLYLRDPAGNRIEVNYPDITELDRSLFDEVKKVGPKPGESPALYTQR